MIFCVHVSRIFIRLEAKEQGIEILGKRQDVPMPPPEGNAVNALLLYPKSMSSSG